MRVLDLFAGLKGWSEPFAERGHEVFSVDLDERFDVDLHKDIFDLTTEDIPWQPDIVLASPPCEKFSVMTIGRNWNKDNTAKNTEAKLAFHLVQNTLLLIEYEFKPKFWVMENPRGKLRTLLTHYEIDSGERRTVSYCQYGEAYMKPTDLWGGFPPSFETRKMCSPRATCHVAAKRGSHVGVQQNDPLVLARREGLSKEGQEWLANLPPRKAKTFRGGFVEEMARFPSWSEGRKTLSALRAKVPYQLALDVCLAAEKDL